MSDNTAIPAEHATPYFHGVEFMTRDDVGYIYFKGNPVEHYSLWWIDSLDAKNNLETLQDRCLFLERNGIEPSQSNAWFLPEDVREQYYLEIIDKLNEKIQDKAIVFSNVASNNSCARKVSYLMPGKLDENMIWENEQQKDFIRRNSFDKPFQVTADSIKYGNGELRDATPEEIKLLNCCFEYLKQTILQNGLIKYLECSEYERDFTITSEESDDEDEEL